MAGETTAKGKLKKGLEQAKQQEASSSIDDLPIAKKRRTKLNKKEREGLLSLLDSVEKLMARKKISMKLKMQFNPEYLVECTM